MLVNYPEAVGFRAIVVGSYADTTSRILEVTVRSISGENFFFPNQPGGVGAMRYDDGYMAVGLMGCVKDTVDGQWVIKIDRGYAAELAGESQPGSYEIPLEGSILLKADTNSVGMEAFLYLRSFAALAPSAV